jgi:hypothetical protein
MRKKVCFPNKKGIALDTAVSLIMGVVFLIVVIYILITTGLLSSFTERVSVMICTASALARSVIIRAIWGVWQVIIIALTIFEMIAFAGKGTAVKTVETVGEAASLSMRSALVTIAKFGAIAGLGSALAMFGLATIATYAMTSTVFPKIPLICNPVTLDVGYSDVGKQATVEEFYAIAGSRTLDCWDMFGDGKWDPLWGQEGDKGTNPRSCFIIDAHLKPMAENTYPPPYPTLKDLYVDARKTYNNSWKLGSDKVYAYCGNTAEGTDFNNWGGTDCQIKNSRIYIMYFDKHEYDLVSYGSSACNIRNDWFANDVTDEDGDRVVWCVKSL